MVSSIEDLKYHLVFATKYRYNLINIKIAELLKKYFLKQQEKLNFEIQSLAIESNYIHMLFKVETSNFDLVDNSKAVATVTGTTGWEAVIRGKPTLVFGHAWYKDCEGASYILSEKDCREAISRINRGYAVNKDLVKLFLYALEKVAIKGYVDVGYEKVANISHKDNIAKLSENINKFYESI